MGSTTKGKVSHQREFLTPTRSVSEGEVYRRSRSRCGLVWEALLSSMAFGKKSSSRHNLKQTLTFRRSRHENGCFVSASPLKSGTFCLSFDCFAALIASLVSCLRAANSTRCLSALASTKDRLNDEFCSLDLRGFAAGYGTLVVRHQRVCVDEQRLREMDGLLEEGRQTTGQRPEPRRSRAVLGPEKEGA